MGTTDRIFEQVVKEASFQGQFNRQFTINEADAKKLVNLDNMLNKAFAKTLSWRAIASLDTFFLGWLVTGDPMAGGSIAALEVATKMFLYYFHERAWDSGDKVKRIRSRILDNAVKVYREYGTLPKNIEFIKLMHKKRREEFRVGVSDRKMKRARVPESELSEAPRRGRYGKQKKRGQQQPKQQPQQPQQQMGLGDFEMSHEQSTLMAFMGIAKRIMGDLQGDKFDDEMLEVLDKVLVAVDEAVRDQRLKAQYGSGFEKYRKDA